MLSIDLRMIIFEIEIILALVGSDRVSAFHIGIRVLGYNT